jgi:ribosome-associated toxin RatA of RatAB toxin-antitoxin module
MASVRYRKTVPNSSLDAGGAWNLVHAPIDVVRKVVQRFDRYDKLLPRLEQSRVVARRHGETDVYMRAPVLHGAVTLWAVIRFHPIEKLGAVERLASDYVEGNLETWHAEWRLIPCGQDLTLVKLEILTDVNIPFPSSLIAPELAYIADTAVTATRDRAECAFRARRCRHPAPEPVAPVPEPPVPGPAPTQVPAAAPGPATAPAPPSTPPATAPAPPSTPAGAAAPPPAGVVPPGPAPK